jgi:hypothetical protein
MCKAVQLLESDGEKQRRAKVWIALMRAGPFQGHLYDLGVGSSMRNATRAIARFARSWIIRLSSD